MLKNGVGRYNIFFNFSTKLAESSFLCRFRVESVNIFACAMCFFFNKQFRTCANALPNEFTVQVVWMYEYCAGKHWSLDWMGENETATYSFVLGYLHMILWKISTGISIKHRILVAQWVGSLHLTTYTSLSPIRRGFAPGFVNYKMGALDSQPQVTKFTSCLPMVGGSLRVLRLPPPQKLVAMT